jgi:hypothetical protein
MAVYAALGIGMHDEESENRDAWSLETVASAQCCFVLSYAELFSFFFFLTESRSFCVKLDNRLQVTYNG